MPILIGTDEAGYGPNLGPLVVAATVWQVDDARRDLYASLADAVTTTAESDADRRIEIADSKVLYEPGAPMERLERGVLAALRSALPDGQTARPVPTDPPADAQQLVRLLCADGTEPGDVPYFDLSQVSLPLFCQPDDLCEASTQLVQTAERSCIRLRSLVARVVMPAEFNRRLSEMGNKATLLSTATLQLVEPIIARPRQNVHLECDRHGGRSKYAALVQQWLTDQLVRVVSENAHTSSYRWQHSGHTLDVCFRVRGESFLPTALASMTAKYVRELFMTAWNRYWRAQLPDLRPTAGYPIDARRFKSEISAHQKRLGITDELIWRQK